MMKASPPTTRTTMGVGKVVEALLSSDFLAPDDIVALLQVQEISDDSNIRHRYCSIHGIKLDLTYEDISEHSSSRTNTTTNNNDDDDDDDDDDTPATATATGTTADQDMEFLMWTLHQQHFILAAPYTSKNEDADNDADNDDDDNDDDDHELPPSLHPDCINCRKAKLEGKQMCPSCHTFEDYRDIYTCNGLCKKTACSDCHAGVQSCSMPECDDKKSNYCSVCFEGYYCDMCSSSYHTRCLPSSICDGCKDHICNSCVDNGEFESFTCNECKKTYHWDCKEESYCCAKCSNSFCHECKDDFFTCNNCYDSYCQDCDENGPISCATCDEQVCSKCNDEGALVTCDGCNTSHCEGCQWVKGCGSCSKSYCDECQNVEYCECCSNCYCKACRDVRFCSWCENHVCVVCDTGRYNGAVWACSHCALSEKDDVDSCANCFLSANDMDGVSLLQCSACKLVKYCSRACQKQDWPTHRNTCTAATAVVHKTK